MTTPLVPPPQVPSSPTVRHPARLETLAYFLVAVLGFSFWFWLVVPFACHRETYWWLGMAHSEPFSRAFGFIVTTYRPLAQSATWIAGLILRPDVFPISPVRQFFVQSFVYGLFVLAWWFAYRGAPERRLFAVIALAAGAVFFSGYVQLFHISGLFYAPVALTLGGLLYFHGAGTFEHAERWFAAVAVVLTLWHPFATALFMGYYFGAYLTSFTRRNKAQHVQALVILCGGMLATVALGLRVQPHKAMHLSARLAGFLVSYRTNEVTLIASLAAFLMAQITVAGMRLERVARVAGVLAVSALSGLCLAMGIPVLLVWIVAVLIKLLLSRTWALYFLTLAALLLPMGGGIGAPVYALFAIMAATYGTAMGWREAENSLAMAGTRYAVAGVAVAAMILVAMRAGVPVPLVAQAARPILAERERTYQLEHALDWLRNSSHCAAAIAFAQSADNPVDSISDALARRYRPPAALGDVQLFWNTALACHGRALPSNAETAVVTFGGPLVANADAVLKVPGRYADAAVLWIHRAAAPHTLSDAGLGLR